MKKPLKWEEEETDNLEMKVKYDVHEKMKKVCEDRDITLTDLLIEIIEKGLEF